MSAANFDAAVAHVRSLPKDGPVKLDNDTKLKCYALFKQATEGDVKGDRPWAVQVESRLKYDAWAALKGTSSEDAKTQYVTFVMELTKEKGHPWVPA